MRQKCEIALFIFIISILFLSEVFAGGGVYWQENGIQVCSHLSGGPKNVFDGKRSAIIVWHDWRNMIDSDTDIYGQRIDVDGNFAWQIDGVPVAITPDILDLPGGAISDGKGGAITTWADGRQWWITGGDIYAQRIDSLGNVLWGSAGTAVCVADSEQENLSMISDDEGGAIIVWEDGRNGYILNKDLYAQRMDSSGIPQWEYNGVPVCTLQSINNHLKICEAPQGVIIVYADTRNGPWWINSDIFAQYIDRDGNLLWTNGGISICTADSSQTIPEVTPSGNGAIIVWNDIRNGNWDIYAQRVRGNGSFAWTVDGIPICVDSGDQGGYGTGNKIKILEDGQGGAIAMWDDKRNGNHDIYMQRIDSLGQVLWQENGVFICTAADSAAESIFIESVSDGRNGVILAWSPWDTPEDENIFAQRVDSSGICQWDSNGIPVCTALHMQILSSICSDGEGGAIISWADGRNDNVYAQRVGDVEGVEEQRDIRHKTRDISLFAQPNPFTTATTLTLILPSIEHSAEGIELNVYDIAGRKVKRLMCKKNPKSRSSILDYKWDGKDEDGVRTRPGVYYIQLKSFNFKETEKVIFIH